MAARNYYRYRVKATNAAGSSAYSNMATVTTPAQTVRDLRRELPGSQRRRRGIRARWTVDTGTAATMDVQSGAGRMAFQNVSGARAQAIAKMPKQADTDTSRRSDIASSGARAGYLYLFSRASGDWVAGYSEHVVLPADDERHQRTCSCGSPRPESTTSLGSSPGWLR